jgi:nucleotide-binding universal stress UspA family protein
VSGFTDPTDVEIVNIGAGGGPHHKAVLPLIEQLGEDGADINVINVDPEGAGRRETPETTLAALSGAPEVRVQNVSAATVAEGLVTTAKENGGILVIGATRTRRLRRWVFGSTPDRVISLADGAGVPVIVYAGPRGVQGPFEDYVYPIYRYLTGSRRARSGSESATESES